MQAVLTVLGGFFLFMMVFFGLPSALGLAQMT